MTAYAVIADSDVDPESPGTTTLFTRLRDNPLAIQEGTSPAPSIQGAALATDAAMLTAINGIIAGSALGAVGTTAYLIQFTSNLVVTAGTNYAGSSLRYSGVAGTTTPGTCFISQGAAPSGTWMALGTSTTSAIAFSGSLFIRIS